MANLEIQIGADSSELNSEISAAEAKIKRLGKLKVERVKLGLDVKELNSDINQAKAQLSSLNKSVQSTGQSFNSMTPKVANGGNALMQFSRIAQDAPYGIIGIGNNITATVEAFGHLKNSTGSTGGALKAMAGSIVGSGGILLAVSLVTTAFTYMSQNGLSVQDVVDKMTGSFDSARKAMQDMGAEASKSAQSQISSVGAYASAAKNINLSMSDRLIAVKKLQDEYPAYFGNLSKEQILNGDVAGAVRGVTNALVAKAKAAGLSGMISDNAKVMYQLDSQVDNINKQKQAWMDMFKNVEKGSGDEARMLLGIRSFNARINDAITEKNKLNRDNLDLTKEINKETAKSIKLEAPSIKAPKKVKEQKVFFTPQVSGVQSSLDTSGLIDVNTIAVQTGAIDKFGNKIKELPGIIRTSMGEVNIAFDTSGAYMLEALQKLNEDMNTLISGSIAETLGSLGTVIGDALANGGNVLGAIGSVLLQSLGKFLSDMGGLLIQYGTMAVIKGKLDLAIATGGPAAIAAGFAAIGVGIALKAIGGAIASKAQGGNSNGSRSVSTGASVSSPQSSTGGGGGGSFQGGTVVFEISGQSLIGVLGNTLDKNKRLGGSLGFG